MKKTSFNIYIYDEEKSEKYQIRTELEKTNLLEISWRQKSRVLWLREGHRNIKKKIQSIANSQKRYNTITNLQVEGEMTTNPAVISNCILQFYHRLYSEDGFQHPSLDVEEFSRTFEENVEWLERLFKEEEVFA